MSEENELSRGESAGLLLALADQVENNPQAREAIAAGFRVIAAEWLRDDVSGPDMADTATGPGMEKV
jgi:hypothetical protein